VPDLESLAKLPFDAFSTKTGGASMMGRSRYKIMYLLPSMSQRYEPSSAHDEADKPFPSIPSEAGDHAGIGEHPPKLFRLLLRDGVRLLALGQRVMCLLSRQVAGGSPREAFEWRISLDSFVSLWLSPARGVSAAPVPEELP